MKAFFPYDATTLGVTVRVNPRYLPEQSDPATGHHVWSYHVRIENASDAVVQLVARHWIITDADGHVEEVEGDGVVGEQPVLKPGGSFDYVSGCVLATSHGTMHGSYMMQADGEIFAADIPRFALASPRVPRTLH